METVSIVALDSSRSSSVAIDEETNRNDRDRIFESPPRVRGLGILVADAGRVPLAEPTDQSADSESSRPTGPLQFHFWMSMAL